MATLPKPFYSLLPVGMAVSWAGGTFISSALLQTLHLARDMPDSVLLMPQLLRHVSPETLAGGAYVVSNFAGGAFGMQLALWSDLVGLKTSFKLAVAVCMVAASLAAWSRTFLLGLMLWSTGFAASNPISFALFTSQFDGEQLTQKLTTYLYAAQSASFTLSAIAAGVQPVWVSFAESAVILLIAWIGLVAASDTLRDATDESPSSAAPPSSTIDWKRVYGFGALCIFTALFGVNFQMFEGGPFMIFADEGLAPIGGFRVPAQWFLSLQSLVDAAVGMPLAWLYERKVVAHLRFYFKLCISFVLMALAYGLLAAGAQLARGGTSPLLVACAVVLISMSEMHYTPVMLAAISTEMPASFVGRFNSIHVMMGAPGVIVTGVGVSCYKSLGAEAFFLILCGVAATGAVGLQLILPFLAHCFDREPKDEHTSLRSIKAA